MAITSPEGQWRQDAAIANSTVTLADAGKLAFRIEEGQAYKFKFVVFYSAAVATTGIGLAVAGPVGAKVRYGAVIPMTATTFFAGAGAAWDAVILATASLGATPLMAMVRGSVYAPIGVSGNVRLRFRSEVAGSAVNILDGSYAEFEPLPII